MILAGTKWMFKSYIDRTITPSKPKENIAYTIKNSNYSQNTKIINIIANAVSPDIYGYQSSISYSGEKYVIRFRTDGKYDLWGFYGSQETFYFPEDIKTIEFLNIDGLSNKEVCKNGFDIWLHQNAIKVMDLTDPNSLKGTTWKIFSPISEGWLGIKGTSYPNTQFFVLEGYEDYGYPSPSGRLIQCSYVYPDNTSSATFSCYMWNRNGEKITIDTKTLKNKTIKFKDITGYDFKFGGILVGDETFRDSFLDSAYRIYYISSISIESTGISGNYFVNDTLDLSNITIKKVYEDGFEETVTSGFTISTLDMSTPGIKTIDISYTENGKTVNTSFSFKVYDNVMYRINGFRYNLTSFFPEHATVVEGESTISIESLNDEDMGITFTFIPTAEGTYTIESESTMLRRDGVDLLPNEKVRFDTYVLDLDTNEYIVYDGSMNDNRPLSFNITNGNIGHTISVRLSTEYSDNYIWDLGAIIKLPRELKSIPCKVYYNDGRGFKLIEPSVKVGDIFVNHGIYFDPDKEEFKVEE
jgi:hypothetical protein